MTTDELRSAYVRYSPQEQVVFLSRLSQSLTISGRDAYPRARAAASDSRRIQMLQGINELQHVIAGQLAALLRERPERYPDHVLCEALFETAAIYGITPALEWAVDQSADACAALAAAPAGFSVS